MMLMNDIPIRKQSLELYTLKQFKKENSETC